MYRPRQLPSLRGVTLDTLPPDTLPPLDTLPPDTLPPAYLTPIGYSILHRYLTPWIPYLPERTWDQSYPTPHQWKGHGIRDTLPTQKGPGTRDTLPPVSRQMMVKTLPSPCGR